MSFKKTIIAAVIAATPALAFTNGSLVPSYLCNPTADGLPKSFGQLLPFTRQQTPTVGFSQSGNQNVKAPALPKQANQQIGNSAYILASFHDSPNSINSINQGITVKTANGGPIVAGQANKLIISSGSANVALKGAVLVGQDANGVRQGSFTDNGQTFINFPGCGKNPQGQISGVIQQTGISATGSYNNLVYNAPDCVTGGNLTLAGLSVTGKGFGTWSQSFQVSGSKCAGGDNNAGSSTATDATGGKGQAGGKAGQTGEKGQTPAKGQAGNGTGDKGQTPAKDQPDTGNTNNDQKPAKGQAGTDTGSNGQTGNKGQAPANGQADSGKGGNGQTPAKGQPAGGSGNNTPTGTDDDSDCDDDAANDSDDNTSTGAEDDDDCDDDDTDDTKSQPGKSSSQTATTSAKAAGSTQTGTSQIVNNSGQRNGTTNGQSATGSVNQSKGNSTIPAKAKAPKPAGRFQKRTGGY